MKKPDDTPMTPVTLTADEVHDLWLAQGALDAVGWTGLRDTLRSIAARSDPDGKVLPKKNS